MADRESEPQDRTGARVLAVAGVVGLLVVLVIVIGMIGGAAGEESGDDRAAEPVPTETAEPEETPKPEETPEPLTAEEEAARQEAVDLVASKGFEVIDEDDWAPGDALQVLIGRATGSGDRLAFFFGDGTYLGNDSTTLSSKLKVKQTGDTAVVLQYGIYQDGDEPGKPTGSPFEITFNYEAGVVEPEQALPLPEDRLL